MSKARIITTNIKDDRGTYHRILKDLQTQISDGYWEGDYDEDEYVTSFKAFLDFYRDYDDTLVISVSTEQHDDLDGDNYFYNVKDEDVISDVGQILSNFYEMNPDVIIRPRIGYNDATDEDVKSLIWKLLGNTEVAVVDDEKDAKIAELESLLNEVRESVRDTVGGKPLKEVDKILRESGYTF